jgi:acetyl-CoA carboxylase biotin carboxylase subunit
VSERKGGPLAKVLIANRGVIAVRIIQACKELGIATVAVYSDADADSAHVRRADEAVRIGTAQAKDSYLSGEAIIAAARQTGADAIHPGYGFMAENPAFARACEEAGIIFVGPSSDVIEQMGRKSVARQTAIEADVPVVPGENGVQGEEAALAAAERIGYPIMIKAVAGGGGRGIRVAAGEAELREALPIAAREAEAAFGDGSLYMERLVSGARHVEVQVLGDTHGNVIHLWERECSMQRRRQKVIEEAPGPLLDPKTRQALVDSAVRLAKRVGYVGAGTMEYLVDGEEFFFLEMNTRIQVEHGVTEMVTGIDIVQAQLRIAAGEPLPVTQDEVEVRGAAIQFRILAEDPERGFFPSPGTITGLELPTGPGVRVDTILREGYKIPPYYDSLIAKLLVWAPTREEALARGRRALGELKVEGIKTSTPLHLQLLDDPGMVSGEYHTQHLEQLLEGALAKA